MELKEYVFEKIEELQRILRDVKILADGLNAYIEQIVSNNIKKGQVVTYNGIRWEVVAYRAPKVYASEYYQIEKDAFKYRVLCLKLVNGAIDKSKFGSRIRKDKKFNNDYYRKGQEKLKKYYNDNVIELGNSFYIKFQ